MAFSRQTFLGASVVRYTSNIGWGMGSPSECRITLVEDVRNGDSFLPFRLGTPEVGHPVYFNHEGFEFFGLLQAFNESNSVSGLPTFDAVLIDPREILAGTQLITDSYSGTTGGVPNLLNLYGYLENGNFGGSQVNEGGMPWNVAREALFDLTSSPAQGSYGGPLQFRGYSYALDLRSLPSVDGFYRIAGPCISLLELIGQVCEDGGCDFFITLVGLTIKVVTVSRATQPPLGTISAIANTNWGGTVVSSNSGLECRNEVTSSFLIGGPVSTLHTTDNLTSFWGYDIDSQPILGRNTYFWGNTFVQAPTAPPSFNLSSTATQTLLEETRPAPVLALSKPAKVPVAAAGNGAIVGHWVFNRATTSTYQTMTLNASPIADIIGSVYYPCSTLELQFAKANYQSWAAFMLLMKPGLSERIPLTNILTFKSGGFQNNGNNTVNDGRDNVRNMAAGAVMGETHAREQRIYQFVRGYADEYLGKKFAASVPFVLYNRDPETLEVKSSYEVSEGGYLPLGAEPLGLSQLNQDILQVPDGRFKAFVKFDDLLDADLSSVSPHGSVIENSLLFIESQVDSQIIFTPSPAVVITLPAGVFRKATAPVGDISVIAAMFGNGNNATETTLRNRFISLHFSPDPLVPRFAAIPLKSNTLTYGPWQAIGATGKVKVEQDSSLTPWGYGGYDEMDIAGNARVSGAVTNMQVGETGSIELAGSPSISLGGTLLSGGPNLTGIDVSIGKDGVTTRYRFATFTPKFGTLSKGQIDRMRRISLSNVELRRSVSGSLRDLEARNQSVGTARNSNRAYRAFLELAPAAVRRESPSDVFSSFSQYHLNVDKTRTTMQASTFEEALPLTNADVPANWQSTAQMHLNGLLRPFSTKPNSASTTTGMASYNQPIITGSTIPCRHALDPWKEANDVEVYAWGDSYDGMHAYRRTPDPANARVIGLRGPMEMVGWGFDLIGNTLPANTGVARVDGLYTTWESGYLHRQDKWKAGPVDLRWDEFRGVWTSQSHLKGRLRMTCPANGSGELAVDIANMPFVHTGVDAPSGQWNMPVWNYFSSSVASGSKVMVSYFAHDNRWYVTSADCAS